MSEEFSAAFYQNRSRADLQAEAERLGVNIDGKFDDDAINIVYNAELRRRNAESAAESAEAAPQAQEAIQRVSDETPNPDLEPDEDEDADDGISTSLEDMTVQQLRDYAASQEIDLTGISKKADIIEAIRDFEYESNVPALADDDDTDGDGDAI